MPKDNYLPKCRSAVKVTWTDTCKNPAPVQDPAIPEVNRSRNRRQYEIGRTAVRPMVYNGTQICQAEACKAIGLQFLLLPKQANANQQRRAQTNSSQHQTNVQSNPW